MEDTGLMNQANQNGRRDRNRRLGVVNKLNIESIWRLEAQLNRELTTRECKVLIGVKLNDWD